MRQLQVALIGQYWMKYVRMYREMKLASTLLLIDQCVIPECYIPKSIHRGLPGHVSSTCCIKGTGLCHTLLEKQ